MSTLRHLVAKVLVLAGAVLLVAYACPSGPLP